MTEEDSPRPVVPHGEGVRNELGDVLGGCVQAGTITGGVHLQVNGHGAKTPVPHELPPDVSGFTGRDDQLGELDRLLARSADSTAVVISAVSGTAGVGKTALAVHWAHRARDRFPDGHLYADLRGYDSGRPIPPAEALEGFLRSLGLDDRDMPRGLDGRATLFRSLVADRRLLIVLDNARSAEQVTPLLPGTSSCFVVITSRDTLPGLLITHSAVRITVDLLPEHEAVALLRSQLARRVDAEPHAAAELAGRCAQLPLALRIAAELAISRPTAKLAELCDELADERRRLELFSASGNPRTAVPAVFSWSYRHLSPPEARAFRLLSLAPTARGLDVHGLAALTGSGLPEARNVLAMLLRTHLARETAGGRFHMHDLLRAYAAGLAAETDTGRERREALERLHHYYVHVTCQALDLIAPQHGTNRPPLPAASTPTPALRDHEHAISWLTSERLNIVTTTERATREPVCDDPATLLVRAVAEHNLGLLARQVDAVPEALRHFEQASGHLRDVAPKYATRIWLDQAEALLTAGLAKEAAIRLDEVIAALCADPDSGDLAEAEVLRAVAALLDGDTETAHEFAHAAERRFATHDDPLWAAIAALIRLRADVSLALGTGVVADLLVDRAKRLAVLLEELRLTDESAAARLLAVRVLLRRNRIAEAETELNRAPRPRRLTAIDHRTLRWLCRAELALARGGRGAALTTIHRGLSELDSARDRSAGLDLASGAALHDRELVQLGIRLMLEDESAVDAQRLYFWLERAGARTYRYEPPVDDPALADRVADYRHLSRTLQLAQLRGTPSRKLAARHAVLQREISRLIPQPATGPGEPATFAQVTEALAGRALISFVAVGEAQLAMVLADGDARLLKIGDRGTATALAWELYADINALAPDHLPTRLTAAVSRSAERRAGCLDTQLLGPLTKLVGDRELVIVPGGPLYSVPWGVLPSLRGRPVVVAPSATAWLAAKANQPERCSRPKVLIRGPRVSGKTSEMKPLKKRYPGALSLDGAEATVATVLESLDGAGLVHLAVHGEDEPENALFSRLELADGPLFAHDVCRLGRPPAHVVLAANELALSHTRPGDEPLGFAGALLCAGVGTVIAAVTRVGDQAAASAMTEFHRGLAAGSSPAVALAKVTARDPLHRPFVCVGASA
ncbi:CHAT domain-containing protein [Amycolatopsis sp. NPDC059021]|uniref:CHAT domain-containing protein n=1 Tax=Amycolatopsis sp. NPDC059021 TaxID=3346704 RepID=UPI003672260D